MKTTYKQTLLAAALVGALALATTGAQAKDLATHFGSVTLDAKGWPVWKTVRSGRVIATIGHLC